MKKALLIIDMQKVSFTLKSPRFDTKGVVDRINTLATIFRNQNFPVIFIQYDGTGTGICEKETLEWQLLNELIVLETDHLIDKTANDVFYNSPLSKKLQSLAVDELVITGCATDFCVAATVQSALAKDFQVTVIADAHTTADRPHASAEQIIAHYNWVWNNMLPTQRTAKSISFDTFAALFSNVKIE